MTTKVTLPSMPQENIVNPNTGKMSLVWQDWFLNVTTRLGGYTLDANKIMGTDENGNLTSIDDDNSLEELEFYNFYLCLLAKATK